MFCKTIVIVVLLVLIPIEQIESLQCYKCGCFVDPGTTTCLEESELNCVIQYVENSYCYILRTAGDIEFGHNMNSDLLFLESLHYIRATEEFAYSPGTSNWLAPKVTQVSYGCDWNLCNSPKILSLLPAGLTFDVSTQLLSNLFVPGPTETFSNCLSCSQCVNSTAAVNCPSAPCSGACLIDDHIDDPGFNDGTCSIVFQSVCTGATIPTTVHIKGNYYLDDKISDITEIDVDCSKNNCNSIANVQAVQKNATSTPKVDNQLFFRPSVIGTTPSTSTDQLIECYVCRCSRNPNSNDCQDWSNCKTEYRNASYCEIVRDRSESPDVELITLGHILKAPLQYPHFIYAVEELELYSNLTWSPVSISFITYVCDWPLCNDPRIIEKLATSFQFTVANTEVAQYIQGPNPLSSCLKCDICTNNTADFSKCITVNCPANGYCFIEQYIDDPQYNDCEYAFQADCEPGSAGSSMIIGATYNIDGGDLDIDQFDLYCSLNNCNNVATVDALTKLVSKDIRLDPAFVIRPIITTTTTTTTTTAPTTTTTDGAVKNDFISIFYLSFPLALWFFNRL